MKIPYHLTVTITVAAESAVDALTTLDFALAPVDAVIHLEHRRIQWNDDDGAHELPVSNPGN